MIAAIAIALATHWKVYPLVVGLLLVLIAPGKFTWRLALGGVVLALVPFLFQERSYVIEQYRLWYDTRTADNRLLYSIKIAPWDLWFVLVRVAGIPINEAVYRSIQAMAGIGDRRLLSLWAVESMAKGKAFRRYVFVGLCLDDIARTC